MSCTSFPIDVRSYKRWQAIEPSDVTVYDPPTDAILVLGSSNRGTIALVGSDDENAVFTLGAGNMEILPLSVKQVRNTGTSLPGYPIGLWRY